MKIAEQFRFFSSKSTGIVLVLILLLGLGLRIIDLGGESLWLDEGGSVYKSGVDPEVFFRGKQPFVSPPLYYLLLRGWIRIFGDSESSIRLPSALFGTLNILLIYLAGKELFGRKTGLTAAFLLAVSVFNIYFSREARMYSLLCSLGLLSMFSLLKMIRSFRLHNTILYFVSTLFLLYTHNLAITIIAAQNIFIIYFLSINRNTGLSYFKKWFLLQFILLLGYMPWLTTLVRQFFNIQRTGYWNPPVSLSAPLNTVVFFAGSAPAAILYVILSGTALYTIGKGYSKKNFYAEGGTELTFPTGFLLGSWFTAPIIIPYLISLFSTPIYISRITIGAAAPFFLLTARGIDNIRKPVLKTAGLMLIAVFAFINIYHFFRTSRKEPIREIIAGIEQQESENELIVLVPGNYHSFVCNYYLTNENLAVRSVYPPCGERLLNNINQWLDRFSRIRIVRFRGEELTPLLEENFGRYFLPESTVNHSYYNYQADRTLEIKEYFLHRRRENFKAED